MVPALIPKLVGPVMTSRDIADLVESRHDKVKQSIERLVERGVIVQPPMGEEHTPDALGRTRVQAVYCVGKRDSYIIVAQLSPEFTARLVDRWQELEAGAAPAVPQSMAQALRLAADQAERLEAQQLQIEAAKPAVEFVERYVQADGLKGFREVCKLLKANEARFREFVLSSRIMYRLGRALTAYQNHIDAGRFEVRAGVAQASDHAYSTTKFTSKGVEWIAGEWGKYQLAHGDAQ
jgi:phage antirepressor YoqD-like protein